jgi:nucleotidyltransferase substrate binding protein (TIGR01987 family)
MAPKMFQAPAGGKTFRQPPAAAEPGPPRPSAAARRGVGPRRNGGNRLGWREMLDCSPLEAALAQLEKSLRYLNSDAARTDPELRKQFRAAAIQGFEFTYELAVKMIRRQLMEIAAGPTAPHEMAFMDFIRTAADAGLVRDVAPFRVYREKRNVTSHTYSDVRAEAVVAGLDEFVSDMHFVLAELKRRNC